MDEPKFIRPLRAQMYVEKVKQTHFDDGGAIIKPDCFDYRFSAKKKFDAIPDFFVAKVLAVGPEERSGLQPGDHTLVWTYAAGDGSVLYAGTNVGERDRLFINGESGQSGEKCDHLSVVVDL